MPARLTSSLAACAAVWVTATFAAHAQQPTGFADAIVGRWDLTVTDGEDTWPSWLEVRLRTESELMGRFVGRFGSVRHLPEIDFIDGELRFRAPVQYEAGERALQFTGRLADKGTLAGSMTDSYAAAHRWTGTRAPALNVGVAMSVGAPIELFDGRSLDGWRGRSSDPSRCWGVSDGELIATPPCVDLISDARFLNFRLRLEFRYPAGSNSGVYLRGRHEVQIQDTAGQALDALRMGAIYGFLTPSIDAATVPDQWQSMLITLIGREVTVELNGITIIDAEQIPGITGGALDAHEGEPGPLMLQGDHGPIRFRTIELSPISIN